ncbi:MAG TPA: CHAD domain-containing protein [Terriglobales bacterium]|nr:CHAD domain-containing protein [Terriglobales bacterium]
MAAGTDWKTNGSSALSIAVPQPSSPPEKDKNSKIEAGDWVKLRTLARRDIDKFLVLVPEVLRDEDHAAIHKIRVASRRIEQVLNLLYPKPRPKYVRNVLRNANRCRRALGEIRNCDALIALADEAIAGNDGSSVGAWKATKEYLQHRRTQKAPAIFKKIGRIKFALPYLRLKYELDGDGDGSSFETRLEKGMARLGKSWDFNLVHRRLTLALDRRWRTFEAAVEDSRLHPSEPVIHGVRIAAKRLRYLVEVFGSLEIAGSADALAWLKDLQRSIGQWHDLEILEKMMSKALTHRRYYHGRRALKAKIYELILVNRQIKRKSEAKFTEMTAKSLEYRKTSGWIANLLKPSGTVREVARAS